ncbi:MAG: hypothetical protein RIK87_24715 [Fuerstiella sp.]
MLFLFRVSTFSGVDGVDSAKLVSDLRDEFGIEIDLAVAARFIQLASEKAARRNDLPRNVDPDFWIGLIANALVSNDFNQRLESLDEAIPWIGKHPDEICLEQLHESISRMLVGKITISAKNLRRYVVRHKVLTFYEDFLERAETIFPRFASRLDDVSEEVVESLCEIVDSPKQDVDDWCAKAELTSEGFIAKFIPQGLKFLRPLLGDELRGSPELLIRCIREVVFALFPITAEDWHELLSDVDLNENQIDTLNDELNRLVEPSAERGYIAFDIRSLEKTKPRLALSYRVSWVAQTMVAVSRLPPHEHVQTFATLSNLNVPEHTSSACIDLAIWLLHHSAYRGMVSEYQSESALPAFLSSQRLGPTDGTYLFRVDAQGDFEGLVGFAETRNSGVTGVRDDDKHAELDSWWDRLVAGKSRLKHLTSDSVSDLPPFPPESLVRRIDSMWTTLESTSRDSKLKIEEVFDGNLKGDLSQIRVALPFVSAFDEAGVTAAEFIDVYSWMVGIGLSVTLSSGLARHTGRQELDQQRKFLDRGWLPPARLSESERLSSVSQTSLIPGSEKCAAPDAPLYGKSLEQLAQEFAGDGLAITTAFEDWFQAYHPLTDSRDGIAENVHQSRLHLGRIRQAIDIAATMEFGGPFRTYAHYFNESLARYSVTLDEGLALLREPEKNLQQLREWLKRLIVPLTKIRNSFIAQLGAPMPLPVRSKPTWDLKKRILEFKGKQRKFAPQTGDNVLDVLNAFESNEWSDSTKNPLLDPDRTRDTLRTINSNSIGLKISSDGNNLCWKCT